VLGVGRGGPLGAAVESARIWAHAAGSIDIAERDALIVLCTVEGLGPATLARLVARLGNARRLLSIATQPHAVASLAAANADGALRSMPDALPAAIADAASRAPEILAEIAASGVDVVTLEDDDYPARLRAIELPPHVLFIDGDVTALSTRHSVAVVGTRHPSESSRLFATRIGAALGRAGAAVVSGLAIGIDGAAHAAVVDERGITVAVLGGGLRRLYPAAHRGLAAAIVDAGGAIVSEFAPRTEPVAGLFPRRNRLISGLADATVVVEAGARSGALITAEWALEQGRECYVVPGSVDDPRFAGSLGLLRGFTGQARVVCGVAELVEDLGVVEPSATPGASPEPPSLGAVLLSLDEVPRRVARELVEGRNTADELVAATGLPIAGVLATLTLLEGRGLVAGAYGRYRPVGQLARASTAGRRARPRLQSRRAGGRRGQ
jgi:DNA processing protein